jgi:hypothetical protein
MKLRLTIRRVLLLASATVLAAAAITWLATGAHRGWTRTEITTLHHDEITGIDYPVAQPGFVAGVDFLGAGLALAAVLALTGALVRAPARDRHPQTVTPS